MSLQAGVVISEQRNVAVSTEQLILFHGSTAPVGLGLNVEVARPLRHTTLGRTTLDEESDRRRHIYLTTYNTYKIETPMPPTGSQQSSSPRPKT